MNLKKNTKLILALCGLATLLAIVFNLRLAFDKRQQEKPHQETKVTTQGTNRFMVQLNQDLQEIKKQLAPLGVTDRRIAELKTKYFNGYLKSDVPTGYGKVSHGTEQFVRSIIRACNLDDKKITIVAWNDPSPAGATLKTIYVNEPKLLALSPEARKFVVGHEVQHIVYEDNPTNSFINSILKTDAEQIADSGNHEHPLCKYSRFAEKRADVATALKGAEWAQGYLEFSKEMLKKYGDRPSGTHPRRSERVALATDILAYLQN